MAKKMLYSVYDTKVQYFRDPMFMRNRGEALRTWTEVANAEKHEISSHPSDFSLMELGEFDDQTGKIEMLPVPHSLGLAVQFKKAPESPAPLFDINQEKVN